MFTRKRILLGGGLMAAVGIVAVAAVTVWYTMFLSDAPARVSLNQAVASAQSGAVTTTVAPAADLAGAWTLAPNAGSFVGYRVDEELARVGSTTAVGRTGNLTATLAFDGSTITAVDVTADLSGLQSDQAMRDNALRMQALQTATYPTASFKLTQPITLDSLPDEGTPITVTAVGDLTLHGVTRSVSFTLQGQRANGLVVVVGSLDIAFADYNIAPPQSMAVLSVANHGTLELQLAFQKASPQS